MKLFDMSRVLVVTAVATFSVTALTAQVESSSTAKTTGPATKEVKVEKGTVQYVSGNDVVIKMDDGEIRNFPNVPDSVRITVEGKQLSVYDLKPGMRVERTTTITTTPRMITTVQTVTGKVWLVTPPNTVILQMENGKNQQFSIPKGQTFNVDGNEVDAFHLKKGMMISATKVTEVPETVVARERKLSGKMPPPPPPPPANQPILVYTAPSTKPPVEMAAAAPAPAPAPAPAAEPAPKKLPKTGSNLPLAGLLGLVSLALAGGMRIVRAARVN